VAEGRVSRLKDVEGVIGAGRHERSGERTTYRNGYRDRTLDTRLGSLQLRIPKLRQGSYFPPFLEPRKTSEKVLVAVIQEAWVVKSRPNATPLSRPIPTPLEHDDIKLTHSLHWPDNFCTLAA
jgi:hypothetical protein